MRSLCLALARLGHDVDLLSTDPQAPTEGRDEIDGRLRLRTFRRNWPARLCPSHGLARALQSTDAAIVHHHSLWLRTLHYARRANAHLVISPRGMMSAWAWRHHPWRKQLARRFVHPGALEAVRGWHATSSDEESEIRALGYHQPICVAPNGVDAPTDAETAAARAHWRSLCPEAAHRPVALFYSRFHRKKRVLELIDTWLAHAPESWLLLLAGIPQDYAPEDLQRRAQQSGGGGRVRAFNSLGHPPPYPIASLFLLPSHNENFGLVVAEAMAHGVPVVVTDTTPWKEIARHDLGWCIPWADYGPALAQAVANGVATLQARGARAREWVLKEFAWEKSARLLADFYAHLTEPEQDLGPRDH